MGSKTQNTELRLIKIFKAYLGFTKFLLKYSILRNVYFFFFVEFIFIWLQVWNDMKKGPFTRRTITIKINYNDLCVHT